MSLKAKSKLAELRKRAGLTQVKLAVLVGVTTNTIQNWEKEDGLNQLEKYLKLGEIFGLDNLKDFFEYVEVSDDEQPKQQEFSLEALKEIRESWGINVNSDQPETTSSKSQSLEKFRNKLGTQERTKTITEHDNNQSSDLEKQKL